MAISCTINARIAALSLALTLSLAACGGGGDGPTDPSTPVVTSVAAIAGENQEVRIRSAAPTPPAVVVKDQNGNPMTGVHVTFSVAAGGGTVSGASATTNASGIATVGGWTVGATPGANTLTATASGGTNPSTQIHVTARLPRWTVLVYMAADNTLAISGVLDIDEMEAAGVNPEVQVVVQAEFSPSAFSAQGCTPQACSNRSNFNTFRYAMTGSGSDVNGPNGTTTDIGNRNMTDPAQLRDFVTWGENAYPAERYAVVLWNHGGGYAGLIEDITSAGSALMSLDDVRTALTGAGQIDILDFDMCLMAGYETLAKVTGLANYAVFSEETEPGDGDPYAGLLQALYANPTADTRAVARMFVDQYQSYYQQADRRASTTKSAYDLAQFASFETSLDALATTLTANIGTMAGAVGGAAAGTQSYEYPMLKDIGNFLDSLAVRTTDPTLSSQIAAVKAQVIGSFRVESRTTNGPGTDARDVSRSTGLNILLPSGQPSDALPDQGPGSFTAYQALLPNKAWTQFLTAWLTGANSSTLSYVDQGNNRFEGYLVWDSAGLSRGVDVDLWVLEPNGNLYIPWMGVVTPNGRFTGESADAGTFYEGYLTNQFVEIGTYKFYADLYADPTDFRPLYDMAYRNNQTDDLSSLLGANPPRLSMDTSWLDDPDPTFEKIENGSYTDLQYFAYVDMSPTLVDRSAGAGSRPALDRAHISASRSAGPVAGGPTITPQQLAAVRRMRAKHPARADRRSAPALRPGMIRPPVGTP